MKNRKLYLLFVLLIVLVGLLAVFLFYRKTKYSESKTAQNLATGHPKQELTPSQALTLLNDVPIEFFGRLVDQKGDPVAGAEVQCDIRIYTATRSTVERRIITSSESGAFSLRDARGESLTVLPKKSGYELASSDTYYKYSRFYKDRHIPDPKNPVIIKMWRLNGKQGAVKISAFSVRIPPNKNQISIDLLTKEIVETGGDLRIKITRPKVIISQAQPQDWSAEVEGVDGGIIEGMPSEAGVTFEAPKDGYNASVTVAETVSKHWSFTFQKLFFVKSRNGKVYSKIFFSFDINTNDDEFMNASIYGSINASGSRSWED